MFSLQRLFETFLILRRIQRDIFINVQTATCKVPVILVGFKKNLNFLDRSWKKAQTSTTIKIRLVRGRVVAWEQTDGRRDTRKLIVAFRNFSNTPKISFPQQPYVHLTQIGTFVSLTLTQETAREGTKMKTLNSFKHGTKNGILLMRNPKSTAVNLLKSLNYSDQNPLT